MVSQHLTQPSLFAEEREALEKLSPEGRDPSFTV
jgi:hypothetical protein